MLFIIFLYAGDGTCNEAAKLDSSEDLSWLRILSASIQNASDLSLSPLNPFIWGQLFRDRTSIVCQLLGIITQLIKCDNMETIGFAGDYRRVLQNPAAITMLMSVSKERAGKREPDLSSMVSFTYPCRFLASTPTYSLSPPQVSITQNWEQGWKVNRCLWLYSGGWLIQPHNRHSYVK